MNIDRSREHRGRAPEVVRGKRAGELGFEHALYINGRWRTATSGNTFDVRDPSTDDVLAQLPLGATEEATAAIEAADLAFPMWSRCPALQRADYLLRVTKQIEEYREPLAQLTVLEQGMPLAASRSSVDYAASFFRWYAEEARRIYGYTVQHPDPKRRLFVEYHPRGVAGVITPWNAPLGSPAKKIAAALAAGCTVVLKPSELTPLSALALAWLIEKADIPQGVLNVVYGDAVAIGRVLVKHPQVRSISFTGSLRTGRRIYSRAARDVKHVTLELGGNAPFIVFADADLDQAITDLIWIKKANSGQICVTANRVYVENSIFYDFKRRLVENYGELLMGDGFVDGVEQGPLITSDAAVRVDMLVKDAVAGGAEIRCGGRRSPLGPNFYPPTVLTGVHETARTVTEEIFGPVLPLMSFDNEKQVVATANDTPFRLAAYAYTSNAQRAIRLSSELAFGVVGLNDPRPVTCEAPFGGVGLSGIGKEGGREGVLEFLDQRLTGFRAL